MEKLRQKWRSCGEKPLIIALVVVILGIILQDAFLFSGSDRQLGLQSEPVYAADDQDKSSDYSFYTLSSTAAAALSSALADKPDVVSDYFGTVRPAAAGGLLGYTTKDNNRGIWGMFMNALSMGCNTKEYSTLIASSRATNLAGVGGSMYTFSSYIGLGSLMGDLGLDVSTSESSIFTKIERALLGNGILIVFKLACLVGSVFEVAINLMQFFNPFQFFRTVAASGNVWFQNHMHAVHGETISIGPISLDPDSIFYPLTEFIGTYWNFLYGAGIAILVISFVVMCVKFFTPGNMGRMQGLRNWIVKGLFIIGGIAILGGTYTSLLGWFDDIIGGGNTAAVKVIATSFFDFESWAANGMPMPDTSVAIQYKDGRVTAGNSVNVQDVCLKLNVKANPELSGLGLVAPTGNLDVFANLVSDMQTNTGSAVDASFSAMSVGANDATALTWADSVISRYVSGSRYYSSLYESDWKGKRWGDADSEALAKYVNFSDDVDSILNHNEVSDGARWSTLVLDGNVINPFAPGSGSVRIDDPAAVGTAGSGTGSIISDYSAAISKYTIGGPSAMYIYNYLNTTFDDNGLKIYSGEESSSEFTRDSHMSVNMAGRGLHSLVIFLTSLLLLACYAIVGIFYGFSLMFGNIVRGFRMLMAVPGAMLGNLASIAKVVSYTVLMIVEILATMFLYAVVSESLFLLTSTFSQLMYGVLEKPGGFIATIGIGWMFKDVIGILTLAFLVWFTLQCIRLRKPVVRVFEEIADNLVQKFVLGGASAVPAMAGAGARSGGGAAAMAAGAATGGILGKMKAKNAEKQAETDMKLAQMFGNNSSALGEEDSIKGYKQAKKDNARQARKEKLEAGKRMAVGAAQVAAGAATGNVMVAAQGAANLAKGTGDMSQAGTNQAARNAQAASAAGLAMGGQTAAVNANRINSTAAGTMRGIEKVNLGSELEKSGKLLVAGYAMSQMSGAGAASRSANVSGSGSTEPVEVGTAGSQSVQGAVNAAVRTSGQVSQGSNGVPLLTDSIQSTNSAVLSESASESLSSAPTVSSGNPNAAIDKARGLAGSSEYTQQGGTQRINVEGNAEVAEDIKNVQNISDKAGKPAMRVSTGNGSFEMTFDSETKSFVPAPGSESLPAAVQVEQQQALRMVNRTLHSEYRDQVVGDGSHAVVEGIDGNAAIVPNAGETVTSVDGKRNLVQVRDGGTVTLSTPGGGSMDVNVGNGSLNSDLSGMTQQQRELHQRMNTVLVAENNATVRATGAGIEKAVMDDGTVVAASQTRVIGTTAGGDVLVASSDNKHTGVIPSAATGRSTFESMTQDEQVQLNTVRSISQNNQGEVIGYTQAGARGGDISSTSTMTATERTMVNQAHQILYNEGHADAVAQRERPQMAIEGTNVEATVCNVARVSSVAEAQYTQNGTVATGANGQQITVPQGVVLEQGVQNVMRVRGTTDVQMQNVMSAGAGHMPQADVTMPQGSSSDQEVRNTVRVRGVTDTQVQDVRAGGSGYTPRADGAVPAGSDRDMSVTDRTNIHVEGSTSVVRSGGKQLQDLDNGHNESIIGTGIQDRFQQRPGPRTVVNQGPGEVVYTGGGGGAVSRGANAIGHAYATAALATQVVNQQGKRVVVNQGADEVQYTGGGGFVPKAPTGSIKPQTVTNTQDVTVRNRVNYRDGGTDVTGDSRGHGVSGRAGRFSSSTVTDQTDIRVDNVENYQQGATRQNGSAGSGRKVPGSGSGRMSTVRQTDTVNVQRDTEYRETGPSGLGAGVADGDNGDRPKPKRKKK